MQKHRAEASLVTEEILSRHLASLSALAFLFSARCPLGSARSWQRLRDLLRLRMHDGRNAKLEILYRFDWALGIHD